MTAGAERNDGTLTAARELFSVHIQISPHHNMS